MMNPERIRNTIRTFAVTIIGVAAITLTPIATTAQHEHHEGSTPSTPLTCDATATPAAMSGHGDHGSPEAEQAAVEPEFDVLYIDMMLPHHSSIIALSEAALPELTDPRLKDMARDIIRAQSSENEQLTQWRIAWYGSGEPVMDDASMTLMLEAMPIGTMDEMMQCDGLPRGRSPPSARPRIRTSPSSSSRSRTTRWRSTPR